MKNGGIDSVETANEDDELDRALDRREQDIEDRPGPREVFCPNCRRLVEASDVGFCGCRKLFCGYCIDEHMSYAPNLGFCKEVYEKYLEHLRQLGH